MYPMGSQIVWRGQTMDARVRERREQLIAAGIELLGNQGGPALTVRAACGQAGLSLKYFYENFANREELLLEVHSRVISGLLDAGLAAKPAGGAEEQLRAVFDAAGRYFEEDPRRARIAFRETIAEKILIDNAADAMPGFILTMAARLAESLPGFTLDEEEMGLAISALGGSFIVVYLSWLEGRITTTRERVSAYCAKLVLTSPAISWHSP
jgi:AcrR family transcriptional regulator